jgi:hypothetical protein
VSKALGAKYMSESNSNVGQRIQEKFQFYIVGLIFTLLGLAVQTASFGSSIVADLLEFGAWACLLLSALLAMSRLEWAPQIYRLFDIQQDLKSEQEKLRQAINTGTNVVDNTGRPIEPNEFLRRIEERLDITVGQIKKIDRGAQWKYKVYKVGFILGLVLLISARAYVPASTIIIGILCSP